VGRPVLEARGIPAKGELPRWKNVRASYTAIVAQNNMKGQACFSFMLHKH